MTICHTFVLEFVTPLTITLFHTSFVNSLHFFKCKSTHAILAFLACYACLAINYKWWPYWHAFPSVPRIYRKFLWLWKCWVRNDRRTIFQYLNSFFQEVNLMFQFFNFSQKFFLFHVYLFRFLCFRLSKIQ